MPGSGKDLDRQVAHRQLAPIVKDFHQRRVDSRHAVPKSRTFLESLQHGRHFSSAVSRGAGRLHQPFDRADVIDVSVSDQDGL